MQKPHNPDGTFEHEETSLLSSILSSPSTHVFFCDFTTGELECKMVATDIPMANGITRSVDKSLIYVADSLGRSITVYKRDKETNELTEEQKVYIPHGIDNVKIDPVSGKVYAGVFTNMAAFGTLNFTGENPTLTGGTLELDYNSETGEFSTRTLVNTNMVYGTSNGMRMDNVVLMGSFAFEGILVCPLDETIPS